RHAQPGDRLVSGESRPPQKSAGIMRILVCPGPPGGTIPRHSSAATVVTGELPEPVVRAEGVTRIYPMPGEPVHALRGVSLVVERRTFLAIAGPSGCGKSTLLHLLGGVDRPTRGTIVLFGRLTTGLSDGALARMRLHHVGFIFQRFFLLPMLTAEE